MFMGPWMHFSTAWQQCCDLWTSLLAFVTYDPSIFPQLSMSTMAVRPASQWGDVCTLSIRRGGQMKTVSLTHLRVIVCPKMAVTVAPSQWEMGPNELKSHIKGAHKESNPSNPLMCYSMQIAQKPLCSDVFRCWVLANVCGGCVCVWERGWKRLRICRSVLWSPFEWRDYR